MPDLEINGETPLDVKVDGTSVNEVRKNSTRVWPRTVGTLNSEDGSTQFLDIYGYCGTCDPSHGSLSGDTSIGGTPINAMRWNEGDEFRLEIDDEVPQSFFSRITIDTEQGQKSYNTDSLKDFQSGNGISFWIWSEGSQIFNDNTSYDYYIN